MSISIVMSQPSTRECSAIMICFLFKQWIKTTTHKNKGENNVG